MVRKKSRFRRIKRLLSVLLLLAMFLGAFLLPPTFAHMTAANLIVQSLPDAQNLVEEGRKFGVAEPKYELCDRLKESGRIATAAPLSHV